MANDGSLPVDPKGSMVRGIFSKIADSYGTFNAVSSLGIYRSWLKVLAETAACTADEKVLDVAGGTGDGLQTTCDLHTGQRKWHKSESQRVEMRGTGWRLALDG